MHPAVKHIAFSVLKTFFVDDLFRYVNRQKVLILAYHGVTTRTFPIQPWTLIPLESFESQIAYLSKRYSIISLEEAANVIIHGGSLPENPAVITFDDGYRNNYTLALPVLQRYNAPATIFLTAGYIGTKNILPLDDAYLAVAYARERRPQSFPEIGLGPLAFETPVDRLESCRETVRVLKRYPTEIQRKYVAFLKGQLDSDHTVSEAEEEFRLLSRDDTAALLRSGLIQVGAHTMSHEICTNVPLETAKREMTDSKTLIEEMTGAPVHLFAYPNGTELDYNEEHMSALSEIGYLCSVTTTSRFNEIGTDPYRLGRICIGPDIKPGSPQFAMQISGCTIALKKLLTS
jgi:peptidoglycan/xylan/chitin deacetylase (PgdA/CDA1 family)